ncbi:Octapeptide-repeat protein T2, partial [Ophiophagus hannah]
MFKATTSNSSKLESHPKIPMGPSKGEKRQIGCDKTQPTENKEAPPMPASLQVTSPFHILLPPNLPASTPTTQKMHLPLSPLPSFPQLPTVFPHTRIFPQPQPSFPSLSRKLSRASECNTARTTATGGAIFRDSQEVGGREAHTAISTRELTGKGSRGGGVVKVYLPGKEEEEEEERETHGIPQGTFYTSEHYQPNGHSPSSCRKEIPKQKGFLHALLGRKGKGEGKEREGGRGRRRRDEEGKGRRRGKEGRKGMGMKERRKGKKEGRREGRGRGKEGRKGKGTKERRKGRKEGRKGMGMKERRKGKKEGRREGRGREGRRREGRKEREGKKEEREGGRKEEEGEGRRREGRKEGERGKEGRKGKGAEEGRKGQKPENLLTLGENDTSQNHFLEALIIRGRVSLKNARLNESDKSSLPSCQMHRVYCSLCSDFMQRSHPSDSKEVASHIRTSVKETRLREE